MLKLRYFFIVSFLFFSNSSSGSEGGSLVREFLNFSIEHMVSKGICKNRSDCLNNERVLYSQRKNGFHLTFYGFSDHKEIKDLISLLVDEYQSRGLQVKMSLSFSKEKHLPNQGLKTINQVKKPYIYFEIYQGS